MGGGKEDVKVWQEGGRGMGWKEEGWKAGGKSDELELMKDKKEMFGPKVRPICLPKTTDSYHTLRACTVVGWGPMYFGGELAQVPQQASVNVLPDVICESDPFYGTSAVFTSSMVCIGVAGRPVNICKGDSGGPLSCSRKEDGRRTVYGLASYGSLCTVGESNDVFTRVSKFLPWILKTIRISMSS
ncbi:hypothetical protein Pcinc_013828 [Petrolisthes cinctipes]|uniref:Peptidase S1 domain-containing protein n=1 Tax=Petrolisthes cinctipes TaxID=88211 RepID=A0AAE1FWM3_PETCI|nr:hypothetical protein Pcinc_013828 [Petrolisthes cinctipes]